MERKIILGNTAQVQTDITVAVLLSLRKEGTINKNYGTESYYLTVTFQIGTTPIESEIFLAKGIDGYGYAREINNPLFVKLRKEGLPKKIRSQLSNFLMDEYDSGQVKEEDLIEKLEELFGVSRRILGKT